MNELPVRGRSIKRRASSVDARTTPSPASRVPDNDRLRRQLRFQSFEEPSHWQLGTFMRVSGKFHGPHWQLASSMGPIKKSALLHELRSASFPTDPITPRPAVPVRYAAKLPQKMQVCIPGH